MTAPDKGLDTAPRRNSVKVIILGEEYTLRTATSPETTRAVAEYVDAAIREILDGGVVVETHKAAILACLRVVGELFEERRQADAVADGMKALSDEVRPWLPPAKRNN